MSSIPPIPPRPAEYGGPANFQPPGPPPVPPLPPDFIAQSQPHFTQPLAAPRPHRLDPDLPANMARTLDDQSSSFHDAAVYRAHSPRPPPQHQINHNPGFALPPGPQGNHRASAVPNPNGWNTWNPATPAGIPLPSSPRPPQHQSPYYPPQPQFQQQPHLSPPMNSSLTFGPAPPQQPHIHPRSSSVHSIYGPPPTIPQQTNAPPSLTAPLPNVQSLSAALPTIQQPAHDPNLKVNWARDVLMLIDRSQQNPTTDAPVGPVAIQDPQLLRLSQVAVPLIAQIASAQTPSPMPIYVAEAVYLHATLAASGGYPDLVPHNPRAAFRDFERAARGGYALAWFRLGRDYENFNDVAHARDCFERGLKLNVESCVYRMGMAYLMGQLGLPTQPEQAVPLLHRAATLASVQVPQPAYVYGLLLLSEFAHVTVPPQLFAPFIPRGSSPELEARKHLERAAYLNFAPAQYKLGHAYEFAQPPFPFDALLSVQYYSLASQQGEIEADMALSKWFLCGAEGSFEKDEALAYTFAEKAARKELPSAEFAMGYYAEVGVGGDKDIEAARKWYLRAAEHGNTDAVERLTALSQPAPQALSRQEHDSLTETKLVRKRTQAKQRSERIDGPNVSRPSIEDSRQVVDVIRKNSVARQAPPSSFSMPAPQAQPPMAPLLEHPAQSPRPPPTQDPMMGASPRLNGPGAGRQFPNQHRYTLVDPGSGSAGISPPPSRNQSPHGRPAGRPPAQRLPSSGLPTPQMGGPNGEVPGPAASPRPPGQKAPTTFAEMGIQGAKLEDKECVIM
ncbi:HCP-like protein [Hygrophoropsis aurantiaca]|uniref:HCP-like protein n=1 Tax=Hygrophoropsis aurantiaca TaxID=72124 RepID=A0ACB8A2A8_9AGAM|nr:HCP-like protein [Hygrophoropsis aurantiaca]